MFLVLLMFKFNKRSERQKDRINEAFKANLSAGVHLFERRKYPPNVDELIQRMVDGDVTPDITCGNVQQIHYWGGYTILDFKQRQVGPLILAASYAGMIHFNVEASARRWFPGLILDEEMIHTHDNFMRRGLWDAGELWWKVTTLDYIPKNKVPKALLPLWRLWRGFMFVVYTNSGSYYLNPVELKAKLQKYLMAPLALVGAGSVPNMTCEQASNFYMRTVNLVAIHQLRAEGLSLDGRTIAARERRLTNRATIRGEHGRFFNTFTKPLNLLP